MTDFKLDTDALISKAHEMEALLLKPTDDFAQYAHRLKGIDVEGMFNMYEMESFIAPPPDLSVDRKVKIRMMDNNLTLVFCRLEFHEHILISIFKRIA